MKKINFLFAIHNHQPVGNFDFVFEEAYQRAYLPFLQVLYRFPSIKIAIHFSGILLDWLVEHRPELIELVKKLTKRGQLEILTGGYYEPILNVIPENDQMGQIDKLTKTLNKLFDQQPQGMWLTERVWEPSMPSILNKAGVKYTITDDTHFKYAGLPENKLLGYYITEDLGRTIFIFPINKRLRYTIPFEDPGVTIDLLRSVASVDGQNLIVFADDGEKFGAWPNTYDHVYNQKWLERFFSVLEENLDWINILHFSEVFKILPPLGKIYLPTASYAEMMHWSLFSETYQAYEDFEHYLKRQDIYEQVQVFVRGGFWRNFLAKYPEVTDMHKKMLQVSKKLWSLPKRKQARAAGAFDSLWAGQCNCPYWHGVFGGLYLPHLRDAIYTNLIKAQSIAADLAGDTFPVIESVNPNIDGHAEIMIGTKLYMAGLNLSKGGMLYELDYKPVNKNLLDTLTRRKEGYHTKLAKATVVGAKSENDETASIHDLVLAKEPDLGSRLFYDFYQRKSFIDHFLNEQTTLSSFAAAQYREEGDFFDQAYQLHSKMLTKQLVKIKLKRTGKVYNNGEQERITVSKSFEFHNRDGLIICQYLLHNETGKAVNMWFGVEFNFALQAGQAKDRYYYVNEGELDNAFLNSQAELQDSNFIGLRDEWRKLDVRLEFDVPGVIWRFPIETISLSEGGFERVYQSSVVLPNWRIELKTKWKIRIILRMNKLA